MADPCVRPVHVEFKRADTQVRPYMDTVVTNCVTLGPTQKTSNAQPFIAESCFL